MLGRTDPDLRADYPDLLEGSEDPATLQTIRDLDAGYSAAGVPPRLWDAVTRGVPGGTLPITMTARRWHAPSRRTQIAVVITALGLAALVQGTLAVTNILNLGKPTNTVPPRPNTLVANFRRAGPFLRQYDRPEVLFLGTMVEGDSAAERWALVKALEQFGTFSGVGAVQTRACSQGPMQTTFTCYPPGDVQGHPIGYATYDLGHARYSSRYVSLTAKDLIDSNAHVATNLSAVEKQLFIRYVQSTDGAANPSSWSNVVWNTAVNPNGNDQRGFPLVSIGGHLRSSYGVVLSGDLEARVTGTVTTGTVSTYLAPFDAIQKSLEAGRSVDGVVRTLVPNVNAESNVITALICHADGKKPASVCSRPAIKQILKHVR